MCETNGGRTPLQVPVAQSEVVQVTSGSSARGERVEGVLLLLLFMACGKDAAEAKTRAGSARARGGEEGLLDGQGLRCFWRRLYQGQLLGPKDAIMLADGSRSDHIRMSESAEFDTRSDSGIGRTRLDVQRTRPSHRVTRGWGVRLGWCSNAG